MQSHSQLSTHFFHLWSHKFRNESIWKSHLNGAQESGWLCSHQHEQTWHHSFQQECTVMQTRSASENPILRLCRVQRGTRRVLFAALLSLCTPSQASFSSLPLNNLLLLAPVAYFPHYWKGIKPQVISSGTAFSHGGYYQISYKRMIVCWYIHVLFCLWKCQRNTCRRRLTLIWITFQKVSVLPKFPGLDTSQKLVFLAVFL